MRPHHSSLVDHRSGARPQRFRRPPRLQRGEPSTKLSFVARAPDPTKSGRTRMMRDFFAWSRRRRICHDPGVGSTNFGAIAGTRRKRRTAYAPLAGT